MDAKKRPRIVESFDLEPFAVDVIELQPNAKDGEGGVLVSLSVLNAENPEECGFTVCPSHARELAGVLTEAADFANRHAKKRGWRLFSFL